jgi:hypothetical protein
MGKAPLVLNTHIMPFPVSICYFLGSVSESDATRIKIVEAISSMVVRYYPLTVDDTQINLSRYRSEKLAIQIFDLPRIKTAVKRGLELLTTWAGNNNDEVRFFSAKGLWETDRGHAAEIFKNLMLSSDDQLRNKIKDLMKWWGIQ